MRPSRGPRAESRGRDAEDARRCRRSRAARCGRGGTPPASRAGRRSHAAASVPRRTSGHAMTWIQVRRRRMRAEALRPVAHRSPSLAVEHDDEPHAARRSSADRSCARPCRRSPWPPRGSSGHAGGRWRAMSRALVGGEDALVEARVHAPGYVSGSRGPRRRYRPSRYCSSSSTSSAHDLLRDVARPRRPRARRASARSTAVATWKPLAAAGEVAERLLPFAAQVDAEHRHPGSARRRPGRRRRRRCRARPVRCGCAHPRGRSSTASPCASRCVRRASTRRPPRGRRRA